MMERQDMPRVRRLVVAAAVFGLVGGAAAPALAQDESAAQEPATLEDVVFAELAAQDAPAETGAEEAPAEDASSGDGSSGEASAEQAAAEPAAEDSAAGDSAAGGDAAAQEAPPAEQGVPAEAILPVPDPVQPVYMTPDELIAGEFPGAEAAPAEEAAAPDAAAETAAAPEDSGGGRRGGGGHSTEDVIGGVIDGVTGGEAMPEDGVVVDGGNIDNSTNLDANTEGGAGLADGSGGDGNEAVAVAEDNGHVGNDGNNRGGRQGRPNLAGIARGGGRGGDIGLADRAIASVGNGGFANANANGGTIMIGPIISGDNKGNTILVGSDGGCIDGPVYIDGGDVDNSLNINLDASGGVAIADASGGSNNSGMAGGGGDASAIGSVGNGGDARANANGGSIMMGPIISGGNEGNTIEVAGGPCGGEAAGSAPEAGRPERPGKPGGATIVIPSQKGKAPRIKAVPSTGAGEFSGLIPGLLALGGSAAAGVLGIRRRRD